MILVKRTALFAIAALLSCYPAFALSCSENTAPTTAAALVQATTNPHAIVIGSTLFLYVQGSNNDEVDSTPQRNKCGGDHIIAYSATLDANGHPGAFTKLGRISPCNIKFANGDPIYYGPGQVFRATIGSSPRVFQLLADISDQQQQPVTWH